MFRTVAAVLFGAALISNAAMAQPSPLEARYDAAIPGPVEALGHEFGEEITPSQDATDYLYALADAAPDRVRVVEYARSWQGRPLVYAVIASPDHMSRMDAIQADLARLADPRGLSDEERDRLIAATPAVVWLSYGVHGNEISPTDSGLRTAYHLLAAQDDPMVETILDETIVVIDPNQNPDGRDLFIQNFEQSRGLEADPLRFAAEHDHPWPGGRVNHYLFDMNRDWFAMTQPETVGRVAAMQEWWPVVVVDSHEMGGDSTYFFPPSAEPFNPQIVPSQRSGQGIIGRNNAGWFDRLGYRYFTREIFDAFYPGYGDMWPTLHGSVALTYEQGSARGLVWRRNDGTMLTFGDGVDRNFIASLSTAQAVAENRQRFLSDFTEFRASAAASTSGPQAVVFSRTGNRWGAERLARLLARQGVEVSEVSGSVCGANLSEGGFLVRFDQPAGRLARTLMEEDTPLPAAYMAEQEARRARGLNHQLYDVTAWSLPLMFNVRATNCRRAPSAGQPVDSEAPITAGVATDAAFGYAVPWTDAGQARLVAHLAREGVTVRVTDTAFSTGGVTYPRGSAVIRRSDNDADLDTVIARLATESGAWVAGLQSSWVDEGPNLGSGSFGLVPNLRIAMAWGEGTSALSAGATRFVLERRYGLPVTVIRTGTLGRADLSGFDALILPESGFGGGYASDLGDGEAIREFVEDGGVLITLGSATRWAASPDVNLVPARRERAAENGSAGAPGDAGSVDGSVVESADEVFEAETPSGARPDSVPGALVRVLADPDNWMSAGYEAGAVALVSGSDIYAPVSRAAAGTALRFAGSDELVESGYLWEESRAQLAFKPFVITDRIGSGRVVAFTQATTMRGYLEGLDLLLLNAIVLGSSQSGQLRY
jgi:hypothetical protein